MIEREAKITARVDGDGDVKLFDKLADGIGESASAASAGASDFDKLEKQIEEAADAAEELTKEVKEAVDGLEQVEAAAKDSGKSLDELAKKSKKTSKTLDSGSGGIGGRARSANKKLASLKGGIGDIVIAFKQGFDQGTEFRNLLADIDSTLGTRLLPSMDSWITKTLRIQEVMDALVGANDSFEDQARRQAQILEILRKRGIEPVSEKLEDLEKQLSDVGRAQNEQAAATRAQNEALQAWLLSLGLSKDTLDATSSSLTTFVGQLLESNQSVDREALGAKLKPQIDDLIAAYKTLGADVPPELLRVARALGLVSTDAEKMAERTAAALASLREELGLTSKQTDRDIQATIAAFSQLSQQEVRFLPPDEKDKIAQQLAGIVGEIRAAGGEITPEIQAIGNEVGFLTAQFAPVGVAARTMGDQTSSAANTAKEEVGGVGEAFEGAAQQATDSASKIEESLGSSFEKAGDAAEETGDQAKTSAEKLGAAFEGLDLTKLVSLAELLAAVETKVGATAAAVSAGASAMASSFAPLEAKLTSVSSQLDSLIAKAAQLQGAGAAAESA